MEDVIKVIIYGVALALWILYKAREQKKSGMWKPRAENKPAVEIKETQVPKTETIRQPVKKPVAVKKVAVQKPVPAVNKKNTTFDRQAPVIELYETPFSKSITEESLLPVSEVETAEKQEEIYNFDLRQAVIGAEILKRPAW
jgi:hypothetical protein